MPPKSHDEPKTINTGLDITAAVVVFIVAIGVFGWFSSTIGGEGGIFDWLRAERWRSLLDVLVVIFSVANAILVAFIIFVVYRFNTMSEDAEDATQTIAHTVLPKEEVRENWDHIRELTNPANPSGCNMAVLRADALLDDILQHTGYEGTTLTERLAIVDPTKLKSLDRVWSAHRLRNAIAHEPLEQHTKETIVYALRSYADAFKELGFME